MSAETASSTKLVDIYIPLLDEGTDVLRPTKGVALAPDTVRVLATPDYNPAIEKWRFPPNAKVRCCSESRGGCTILVAREQLD